MQLASNISAGGYAYQAFVARFQAVASGTAGTAQAAMGQVYQRMIQQATMLAYQNAFYVLAVTVFFLSPLVWIMRLPPKTAKIDPEALGGH